MFVVFFAKIMTSLYERFFFVAANNNSLKKIKVFHSIPEPITTTKRKKERRGKSFPQLFPLLKKKLFYNF
jgi:hypothetical protein